MERFRVGIRATCYYSSKHFFRAEGARIIFSLFFHFFFISILLFPPPKSVIIIKSFIYLLFFTFCFQLLVPEKRTQGDVVSDCTTQAKEARMMCWRVHGIIVFFLRICLRNDSPKRCESERRMCAIKAESSWIVVASWSWMGCDGTHRNVMRTPLLLGCLLNIDFSHLLLSGHFGVIFSEIPWKVIFTLFSSSFVSPQTFYHKNAFKYSKDDVTWRLFSYSWDAPQQPSTIWLYSVPRRRETSQVPPKTDSVALKGQRTCGELDIRRFDKCYYMARCY